MSDEGKLLIRQARNLADAIGAGRRFTLPELADAVNILRRLANCLEQRECDLYELVQHHRPPSTPPMTREALEEAEQGTTSTVKESQMIPTIGRIVHYTLDANDAAQINRRRTTRQSIADRMKLSVEATPETQANEQIYAWPAGAQAHMGNEAQEGDVLPMLIVKCWGDTESSSVNGQVFLDGNDSLWATSVAVGTGPRTWAWPTRG